jgi:hypothetical protein
MGEPLGHRREPFTSARYLDAMTAIVDRLDNPPHAAVPHSSLRLVG